VIVFGVTQVSSVIVCFEQDWLVLPRWKSVRFYAVDFVFEKCISGSVGLIEAFDQLNHSVLLSV